MSITTKGAIEWLERRAAEAIGKGSRECYILAIAALREKAEREDPKPLTLEELRQMDGEPVYVKDLGVSDEEWRIVFVYDDSHISVHAPGRDEPYFNDDYGKTWIAYRHKPKEVAMDG